MGMSYFICPFVEKKKKLFFSLQLIDLALFKKKKKTRPTGHIHMDLCLDLQFYSVGLCLGLL